jgi:DNA polymerase epsilon subunit 1
VLARREEVQWTELMRSPIQVGTETIVEEWLLKRFEGLLVRVERQQKWDLKVVSYSRSSANTFLADGFIFQAQSPPLQTSLLHPSLLS